jgi:hypothetical protein
MCMADERSVTLSQASNSERRLRLRLTRRYEARFSYDTTLSGATFSASKFSPIARAMKRAVIGVPS